MNSDWLFWAGGALVSAAGLALLWWALFADRARGRRRCPKCWYDMSMTQGRRCPECGREAKTERRLFTTRRRWKWVWASLCVFIGAVVVAVQPKVQRDGWGSMLPATALIMAVRWDDKGWAFAALERRIEVEIGQLGDFVASGFKVPDTERMYDWQWQMLSDECVAILRSNRPGPLRLEALQWLGSAIERLSQYMEVQPLFDAIAELLADPNPQVRGRAALGAAQLDKPELATERIAPLLQDSVPKVRESAVTALQFLSSRGNSAPLPHLIGALGDSSPQVRHLAASSIGYFGSRGGESAEAFDALLRLADDSDPTVRHYLPSVVVRFSTQQNRAMEFLQGALNSPDESLRCGALEATTSMQVQPAFVGAAIVAGLRSDSSAVRKAAIDALGFLRGEALTLHREKLKALAESHDPAIAEAVRRKVSE